MSLGILLLKIQMIVGSFRIVIFHYKSHVFFCILPHKILLRKLSSIVGVSAIKLFIVKHMFIGVKSAKMQIQEAATIVGSFRLQVFHRKTLNFGVLRANIQIW